MSAFAGVRKQAYDVNAVLLCNDYAAGGLVIPDVAALQIPTNGAVTVFCRAKAVSPLEQGYVFGKVDAQSNSGFGVYHDGVAGVLQIVGLDTLNYATIGQGAAAVRADTTTMWMDLALVLDASLASGSRIARTFLNNRWLHNITNGTFTIPSNVGKNFVVGNRASQPSASAAQWAGAMSELRIWNRALSLAECQIEASSGVAMATTGLIGYYHLSEGGSARTSVNNVTSAGVGDAALGANATWLNKSAHPGGMPSARRTQLALPS